MVSSHSVTELRIVLLGLKDVGKSAIGNAILGKEVFKETETTECEAKRWKVEERDILLIDTPGINNPSLIKEQWRSEIKKCLVLSAPGPHVFLLVMKLGRFTDEERNTFKWIQENFGEEALKFTMILFMGREEMSSRQYENFCQETGIKDFTRDIGCGYKAINSKKECNSAQIAKILEEINQIVVRNRGKHYHDEMFQTYQVRRKQGLNTHEKKNKIEKKQQRQGKEKDGKEHERKREERGEKEKKGDDDDDDDGDDDDDNDEDNISISIAQLVGLMEKDWKKWEEVQGTVGGVTSDKGCDVRIVLIGRPLSGKSATGNTILGREAFEKGFYKTEDTATECKRQDGMVGHKSITVIDTNRQKNQLSYSSCPVSPSQLEQAMSLCSPGPHVFLFVTDLPISTWKSSDLLEKHFGQEFIKRTIVLLTHGDIWGRESDDILNFILVNGCNVVYQIFNNDEEEDRTQVTELMEKINRVIKKNGGQHYTIEMYQEAQRRLSEKQWCSVM